MHQLPSRDDAVLTRGDGTDDVQVHVHPFSDLRALRWPRATRTRAKRFGYWGKTSFIVAGGGGGA